ncbi:hypothetical protein [Bradyrhizobium roseum]|uniref:hypothetical protein n=1 Tax=Bradyrhizobium roseum TaxID=3056648 RepID=UPI002637B281|nr:hypothetical protein [Bradyrhizobium roseus]WKA26671.1 hypothetical protein QUH67_24210 [Bradyrhizobium roseus]
MRHDAWTVLGQLALLIIAVAVALLLAEVWLLGVITLLEAFPQRPVVTSGVLLSIAAILLLCIRGTKAETSVIYFVSRAVLLIGSAIAGIAAVEVVYLGAVGLGSQPSLEAYSYLAGGLILVAAAAAGVKYSFDWRFRHWIVFCIVLAAVVLSIGGASVTTFLL